MDTLECGDCGKKYNRVNNYLKHVEKEMQKNCKCNKKKGGKKILLPKKKIAVYTKSKPKTEKEGEFF